MEKIHDYFVSSYTQSDRVVCKICKKMLSSSRTYNLKIHLRNCHNIKLSEDQKYLTKVEKKVIKRNRIEKKVIKSKSERTKFEINKFEIIRSYIGLVTENGFSYDLLNSRNFKNVMKPICRSMTIEDDMFALNANNAKLMVAQVGEKLKTIINRELCNNLFSLKIDSVKRLERNIFTVSIQYCKDGNIISRIIGMSKFEGSIKFKNLSAEVIKILSKFDLSLEQVVSVTADNGVNMLKNNSLLSKCIRHSNNSLENNDYLMLMEEIANDKDFSIGEITVCRCAAYAAQLVAIDAIKETELKSLILRTRNFVKLLRNPTNGFDCLFESRKLEVPQIDCLTRWGSTFRMMSDVKSSKSIIENVKIEDDDELELEINEKFWDDVNDFVELFEPINEILLKFQEKSLNYGDFYANWLRCKLLIKLIVEDSDANSFVKRVGNTILEAIEIRSKKLLENDFLKACLFCDPRFQHTLAPTEKEQAICFLKKLWDKFISIRKDYVHITESDSETEDTNEYDILTAFLKPKVKKDYGKINVYRRIENLKLPFLRSTNCVLQYWMERRFTDPELYILSNIIFGVPPTQVSVESAFASLRLSHENLEDILLAKLNSTLLDECINDLFPKTHFASSDSMC